MTDSAHTTVAPTPRRRRPASVVKITRARRARVEQIIDELLQLLDTIDGDPDSEDGADDEPSLGA